MIFLKTYKQKNQALLGFCVFFLVVVYWLALGQTIELYGFTNKLEVRLDSARKAPVLVGRLTAELRGLDQKVDSYSAGPEVWQGILGTRVAAISKMNGVTLINLPLPLEDIQNDFIIQTCTVKLEGSFKDLLKTVYDLERAGVTGKIVSLRFALEEDRRSKRTSLYAYVFVQNIGKKSKREASS